MTDFTLFNNSIFPPGYASIGIGILTAFFLYLEWKRKNKYLILRLAAVLLASLSLLAIILKPTYPSTSRENGVLLLTPGYKSTQVDSLLQGNPDLTLFHTNEALPYKDSKLCLIDDLSKVGLHFMLGKGIPPSEVKTLGMHDFTYLPASLPEGIVELTIPDRIIVNTKTSIAGRYNVQSPTKLRLLSSAGAEDSVMLDIVGINDFTLLFKPKLAGQFIYTLEISNDEKRIVEKLPIYVIPESQLNILIIQSAPGVEIKQLKNYLAEHHHRITSRYQLSKSNFRYEYINTQALRLNNLTPDLLSNFDLLLLESTTLSTLSTREIKALEQAVNAGLGLLLLVNIEDDQKKLTLQFIGQPLTKNGDDTVTLVLDGGTNYPLRKTTLGLNKHPSLLPHLQKGDKLFSGYRMKHSGKVGFQLLYETYRLSLEGKKEAYAFIWNPLIASTARTKSASSLVSLQESFPIYPNDQLTLDLLTTRDHPILKSENLTMPLQEDILLDNQWHATTWAPQPGWHSLKNADDSIIYTYYVTEKDTWASLRVSNQMSNLKSLAKGSTSFDTIEHTTERKAFSLWIFYCLFLLSFGFLWLAPKL